MEPQRNKERLMLNQQQNEDSELLTEAQAAEFLKFSPKALQKWRCVGNGPKFIKISSKAIRYMRKSLIEWANERMVSSTSDKQGA